PPQDDFTVVAPTQPLQAAVGQNVVLPCRLSPALDAQSLEIRWIRHSFTKTVHHYRNGRDLVVEQLRDYVGRTELVKEGLSSGNLDLRLLGVRPSDDGEYICTVQEGSSYGEASVDLEVAGAFFHNPRPWMAALGVFLTLSIGFMVLSALLLWKRRHWSRQLGESSWSLPPTK
ncbi:MOG protein, partial [Upupa epops]|nr:MOG protein [Upupa epops]